MSTASRLLLPQANTSGQTLSSRPLPGCCCVLWLQPGVSQQSPYQGRSGTGWESILKPCLSAARAQVPGEHVSRHSGGTKSNTIPFSSVFKYNTSCGTLARTQTLQPKSWEITLALFVSINTKQSGDVFCNHSDVPPYFRRTHAY